MWREWGSLSRERLLWLLNATEAERRFLFGTESRAGGFISDRERVELRREKLVVWRLNAARHWEVTAVHSEEAEENKEAVNASRSTRQRLSETLLITYKVPFISFFASSSFIPFFFTFLYLFRVSLTTRVHDSRVCTRIWSQSSVPQFSGWLWFYSPHAACSDWTWQLVFGISETLRRNKVPL